MFLAALAGPRNDRHEESSFDAKIGLWPFEETTSAKPSSANRPKGSPVTIALSADKEL